MSVHRKAPQIATVLRMQRCLVPLLCALALLLTLVSFQDPASTTPPRGRTVILVRHAEKDPAGGEDPGLSGRGTQRAEELARLLSNCGASQLLASNYQRTQATLAPLAKALKLETRVIPAQDHSALVEACRNAAPGSTTVVCGHSNTIPKLAMALGVTPQRLDDKQRLPESEYTRVFLVHLPADAGHESPSLTELALSP